MFKLLFLNDIYCLYCLLSCTNVTDDQPFPSLISTSSGVGIVIWDKVIIEGLSVGIVFYLNHVMYLDCESLNVNLKSG